VIGLEQLSKRWTSPIYTFFNPTPAVEYINGHHCHIFNCAAKSCKQWVHQFLDKDDAGSTSNLWKHALFCWGEASVKFITELSNIKDTRESVKSYQETGSITASFERIGKDKMTYSHRQHMKTETKYVGYMSNVFFFYWSEFSRAEIVHWVSESLRPFLIVKDRGFLCLMKTGRPEYYLPSPSTVSHDVRLVFANVWRRMAKMMQVFD
jgi:hypothetical protein